MLIEAALEARPPDAHKIELEVFPDNEAAIELYRSLGFEQEGLRRDHYRREDGSLRSALLMARLFVERATARAADAARPPPRGSTRRRCPAPPPSAPRPGAPSSAGRRPGARGRGRSRSPTRVPHSPPTASVTSPGGDDGEVAGVPDAARDHVGAMGIRFLGVDARDDPDHRPAGLGGAARRTALRDHVPALAATPSRSRHQLRAPPPCRRPGEADLRERPPLAADRDHRLAEATTARLRRADPVATTWVQYAFASRRVRRGRSRSPSPPASAAAREPPPSPRPGRRRRGHARLGQQPADLLGQRARPRALLAPAAADHRDRSPPASIIRISSSAPALCSGSLRLPHLGLCTQEGQPDSQGHSAISRSASPSRRSNCS